MNIVTPNIIIKSQGTKSLLPRSLKKKPTKSKLSSSKAKLDLKTPTEFINKSITKKNNNKVKVKVKAKANTSNENKINTSEINFNKLISNDNYNKFILNQKKILNNINEKMNYLLSFNESEYDLYCDLNSKVPLTNSQIKLMKYHK